MPTFGTGGDGKITILDEWTSREGAMEELSQFVQEPRRGKVRMAES